MLATVDVTGGLVSVISGHSCVPGAVTSAVRASLRHSRMTVRHLHMTRAALISEPTIF